MKLARVLAAALIVVMIITAFAGCTARNRNVTSSVPNVASSVPPVVSAPGEAAGSIYAGEERSENALEESFETSAYERSEELAEGSRDVSDVTDHSVASAMSTDFSEIGALDGTKDTGFPGGPVDSRNRPSGPLGYQEKFGKYDARFIVPDSDKIYLTFDEGYENGYTSRILDVLKEKNVKAVFFITYPYAQTEAELVKRMIDEGHTLANHSTKHLNYPDMPLVEAAKDLMTLHEYVLANYGYKMWLFRPPEGAFSEQTLALAQALDYDTMLWSFAYKDYDVNDQPLAIEALDKITSKAHPGEICLLHAVSKTNAEVLGEAIDLLRAEGFEFADYFYFR